MGSMNAYNYFKHQYRLSGRKPTAAKQTLRGGVFYYDFDRSYSAVVFIGIAVNNILARPVFYLLLPVVSLNRKQQSVASSQSTINIKFAT